VRVEVVRRRSVFVGVTGAEAVAAVAGSGGLKKKRREAE
jgi:hypothetical protein